MLGRRDPQQNLFHAKAELGGDIVSQLGIYKRFAEQGHRLFRDDDFVGLYCLDNGRPSAPPSLLAIATLLQIHERVSDAEVIQRCCFDLRWKVALDLVLRSIQAPFAKSTFQAFRARLVLHEQEGIAFEKSLQLAAEQGLLPKSLRLALDSSPVRGRGAVKDTFNLLSDAIRAVLGKVAEKQEKESGEVAQESDLSRHVESPSLKGSEVVDWSDKVAVAAFLQRLLEDCERVVALAEEHGCAGDEVALLLKVIEQNVDPSDPNEPKIARGVAKDRVVSINDPQMRHGRKSSGHCYDGHKGHIAVEVGSGLITAVEMTAPGTADGSLVKTLVEQSKELTKIPEVSEALGDCAYGSRTALEQAAGVKVELLTKMPRVGGRFFGPQDFEVSEDRQQARCPAGHTSVRKRYQRKHETWVLFWSPEQCGSCPLKQQCTKATHRSLHVAADFHARRSRERFARSEEGRAKLRERLIVEHRLARLKQLGAGSARYFGRVKTGFQWRWASALANLCLTWASTVAFQDAEVAQAA